MLETWTAYDLRRFAALLAQFNSDFDRSSDMSPLSEKVDHRDHSAGRNA
jgi:hypothetical protein